MFAQLPLLTGHCAQLALAHSGLSLPSLAWRLTPRRLHPTSPRPCPEDWEIPGPQSNRRAWENTFHLGSPIPEESRSPLPRWAKVADTGLAGRRSSLTHPSADLDDAPGASLLRDADVRGTPVRDRRARERHPEAYRLSSGWLP